MEPVGRSLLDSLSFVAYPHLITTAVQEIAHNTSVIYSIPPEIIADLRPITELLSVYVHCIICRYSFDANRYTIVFLDKTYSGESVDSPSLSI